jgi:hypothetical protein
MGHRQEPRVELNWPASLCGVDAKGRSFLQSVTILNISGRGILLDALQCQAKVGDTVVLRCGKHHGRFLVVWLDQARGANCRVGLQHTLASPIFWGLDLPLAGPDPYRRARNESRRRARRHMAQLAVEVRASSKPPIWSSTANISEGGCFVHMLNGLPLFTRVDVALWRGLAKVWAQGIVVSSTKGSGVGIKFLSMSESAREIIQEAVQNALAVEDRREGQEQVRGTAIESCSDAAYDALAPEPAYD